jgi:transcription factor C subunit 6
VVVDSTEYDGAQYLALSTLPSLDSQPAIGDKWASDSKGCIQIWAAVPPSVNEKGAVIDGGSARCELVLCVDGGPIHDLKWMPMGAWDDVSRSGETVILISAGIYK